VISLIEIELPGVISIRSVALALTGQMNSMTSADRSLSFRRLPIKRDKLDSNKFVIFLLVAKVSDKIDEITSLFLESFLEGV